MGKPQVTNPTLSKSILEDAFVEAVYNGHDEVTISDLTEAIVECDKLSPTIRKEVALKLKKSLEKITEQPSSEKTKPAVLQFPGLKG